MNSVYKILAVSAFAISLWNFLMPPENDRNDSSSYKSKSTAHEVGCPGSFGESYFINIFTLITEPNLYDKKEVVVEGFFKYKEDKLLMLTVQKPNDKYLIEYGETLYLFMGEAIKAGPNEKLDSLYRHLNGKKIIIKGIFNQHGCENLHSVMFGVPGEIRNAKLISVDGSPVVYFEKE